MSNLLLAVNFIAETAIPINRITKPGASDLHIALATAATDSLNGVVNELSVVIGERADVVRQGIGWVEAGAAVPRGSPITSDATGRGIVAAPAAGSNVRVIGFADESATAAGDVIRFLISPCVMQG